MFAIIIKYLFIIKIYIYFSFPLVVISFALTCCHICFAMTHNATFSVSMSNFYSSTYSLVRENVFLPLIVTLSISNPGTCLQLVCIKVMILLKSFHIYFWLTAVTLGQTCLCKYDLGMKPGSSLEQHLTDLRLRDRRQNLLFLLQAFRQN